MGEVGKFKELLESEIKVLKSCECHNIIKLYDMKKTANNYYLVLEYCNEGDLDSYVKKRRFLTEEEAIEILCEVINGFRHLYNHKILHRDLKLANILRHDGVTKIADFGFSKMLGPEALAETMLGSPLNMAPEVLNNQEYSNKADIYSLGVCYYWMLFGKYPSPHAGRPTTPRTSTNSKS